MRAQPEDAAAVRAVRLAALRDAPAAFGSTVERESAWSPDQWREQIARDAIFLAMRDGEAVGIAAGTDHRDDPQAAFLEAVWVTPSCRGLRVGDRLVESVVRWSVDAGRQALWLHVLASDPHPRRLYERHGFRDVGVVRRERDGVEEIEMVRALS